MSELVFKVPVTATRGQYCYPESQSLPLEFVKQCSETQSLTKEVSKSIQSPSRCHSMSELVFKVPVSATRGQYYHPVSLSLPLEVSLLSRVPVIAVEISTST